jgi:hypothetical protein
MAEERRDEKGRLERTVEFQLLSFQNVRAIAWNWNTIGSGGSLKGTVGLEGAGA